MNARVARVVGAYVSQVRTLRLSARAERARRHSPSARGAMIERSVLSLSVSPHIEMDFFK